MALCATEVRRKGSLIRVSARASAAALAFSFVLGASALSQQTPVASVPSLTAHQIASMMEAKNKERAEHLNNYLSTRTYELEYKGFPSHKQAKMVVNTKYQAPEPKQLTIVSEEGSGLLREKVLRKLVESERESTQEGKKATALSEENYDFTYVGTEVRGDRTCYLLEVKPKKASKFLYTGRVWIDAKDFAVVHISAQPAKNPSFWIKHVQIEHDYQKFGEFWLPVRNESTSATRFGGQAKLVIDYGKYQFQANSESKRQQVNSESKLTLDPSLAMIEAGSLGRE